MATNPPPGEEDPKKRRTSGAPQQPIQPSQPLSPGDGRALGQMQGMAARAVAQARGFPSKPLSPDAGRALGQMQGIGARAAAQAFAPPTQPSQPLSPEAGRALGQMQGAGARAAAQAFAPPGGPRPVPPQKRPGETLGSVMAGGPGTAEVGGFRVSNLPDYSNAPAQPGSGAAPALARAGLTGPGIGDAAAAAIGMMGRNPTLQPQQLPDYSQAQPAEPAPAAPPANPQAAQQMQAVAGRAVANALPPSPLNVPAPAPSASAASAQGGYDQMPPDRVQQEIAARQPLMTTPGGSDTAGRLVDSGLNVARGFGQLALGGASAVVAPILDTARNGITRLAGGNPETLPGGSSGFYNSAMENISEGWEPIAAGGRQIGAGIRGLLGAAQAQEGPVPASATASPASARSAQKKPPAPEASATDSQDETEQPGQAPARDAQQPNGLGFRQTGINGVVGRRNAQGVMEFSNAQADVAGASGERLVDGTIGDGIGGLSVGQASDAQTALGRFEGANAERAGMIEASRRGAIGDTGNFTVVEDGTRGRQADRDMEARRRRRDGTDVAMERNRLQEQELRQSGINSYLDRQLREREVANAEQTGTLQRQQAEQELQAGQLTLQQQRQIQDLRTRLADPNLDKSQRDELERAYAALTTPAKDRYVLQDVVLGRDNMGAPITGKAAVDVTTGQVVGGQSGSQPSIASDPRALAIKNNPDLSRDEKAAQLKALGYN